MRSYLSTALSLCFLFCGMSETSAQDDRAWDTTQSFNEMRDSGSEFFDKRKGVKGSGYKPYKRFEYKEMFDSYPSGKMDSPRPDKLEEFTKFKSSLAADVDDHNGDWSSFGSGNGFIEMSYGNAGVGRINCIAQNPLNSNEYMAGSPSGGLWKSTDDGDNWFPVSDGIPQMGISEIVYHPTNPNIIYLNTGDGDGRDTRGVGILKSVDGGDTWFKPGSTLDDGNWQGFDLEINPDDPDILVASCRQGLHITYDGGDTWVELRDARYFDIEFRADNSNIFYAAYATGIRTYTYDGIEYTSPGGVEIDADGDRIEIEVATDLPDNLYAIVGSNDNGFEGLYWSWNDGVDWLILNDSPNILHFDYDVTGQLGGQAWYDMAMVIDPTNSTNMLTGGINIWGTNNLGFSWDIKTHHNVEAGHAGVEYVHADIHDLVSFGNEVWACTDGGVWRSTDFGETWEDRNIGFVISQLYRIDSHPNTPNLVIGGCQDTGTNLYDTDDEIEHVFGADGMGAEYSAQSDQLVYMSVQDGNLFLSADGGLTYNDFPDPTGPFYTHFVVSPEDAGDKFYGGTDGLYRQLNGSAWPASPVTSLVDTLVYVVQAPGDVSTVYACSINQIVKSNNALAGPVTWTDITGTLPIDQAPLRGIGVDPADEDHVWVTFRGFADGVKMFESINGGSSWNDRSENLPNFPVHCVLVDPNNSSGTYIGTDIGVFYRNTYTDGWMWYSNGLPVVPIYDMKIMPSIGKIRIGTHGRGVWESPMYSVCEDHLTLTPGDDPGIDGFSGQQTYEASQTLTSTRVVEGGIGSDVHYQAGDQVTLLPGFEVKGQSEFRAVSNPCSGSAPPLVVDPDDQNEDQ